MKKILLSLSILSIIIITSCGSDDSAPTLGLSGTVNFNDQSYTIANGIFTATEDDGSAVGVFFMSDGTLTATSSGASSEGSTIIISITAVDVTSTTLSSGSYITSSNTEDMYAFVSVTTVEDGQQVTQQSFVGGSVTISGSGNTYNVTFVDVPFGQGVTLTGTVSGTYSNT